ncbi:hypothetical protein, partial [Streptomyces sp. NPDC058665]|uniref:hypothetical protein n=1 Tax=Streptomyces sp. NPDC058665 TaxID=3346586 RepID=UPI00364F9A7B
VTLSRTRSIARVTVVSTPSSVRVSVISEDRADRRHTEEAPQAHGRAADAGVTVARTTRDGSLWVEAVWQRPTELQELTRHE